MADFSFLKNPYVLAGGAVLIGLGVIASISSGGGSSGAASATSSATIASYNDLSATQNTNMTQLQIALGADQTSQIAAALGTLSQISANQTSVQNQAQISQSGVINNMVQNNSAIVQDALNNSARTQQTWMQTQAQIVASNDQVSIAKAQANAASQSSLFSAIGNVGKAAATAFLI